MRNMVNFTRTFFPAGTYSTEEEGMGSRRPYLRCMSPLHLHVETSICITCKWRKTSSNTPKQGCECMHAHTQNQHTKHRSSAGAAAATAFWQMKIEEVLNSLAATVLPQHSAHGRLRMEEEEEEEGWGRGVLGRGGGQWTEQGRKPWWSTCSPQQEDRSWGEVGRWRLRCRQRARHHRF